LAFFTRNDTAGHQPALYASKRIADHVINLSFNYTALKAVQTISRPAEGIAFRTKHTALSFYGSEALEKKHSIGGPRARFDLQHKLPYRLCNENKVLSSQRNYSKSGFTITFNDVYRK
jgi:hypothetical protein